MNSTHIWLIVLLGIASIALIWRNKRRFDRTNEHGIQRHGRYWNKVRAESFDTTLLWVGYLGLSASVVILITIDPSLLVWLLILWAIVYWVRVHRNRKS
jgi:hypothetical protein